MRPFWWHDKNAVLIWIKKHGWIKNKIPLILCICIIAIALSCILIFVSYTKFSSWTLCFYFQMSFYFSIPKYATHVVWYYSIYTYYFWIYKVLYTMSCFPQNSYITSISFKLYTHIFNSSSLILFFHSLI